MALLRTRSELRGTHHLRSRKISPRGERLSKAPAGDDNYRKSIDARKRNARQFLQQHFEINDVKTRWGCAGVLLFGPRLLDAPIKNAANWLRFKQQNNY